LRHPILQTKKDTEIYVMDGDGSGKTILTSNSVEDIEPACSPDGAKIAFASYRDGTFDIYTMDAEGSDVAQVTKTSNMEDRNPEWQPLPGTTVIHPPDTGGSSLLLVASALLFAGGFLFYARVKRRM
jgi:Tol biopolymer transport system component